jgi:parallel beta-helix repeat protein
VPTLRPGPFAAALTVAAAASLPATAQPSPGSASTVYEAGEFGATGDDTSDDTAAIQSALDAARDAGGGRVHLPAGTYIVSGDGSAGHGAVRIGSNTELYGDGIGETVIRIADGYADKITGIIRTPFGEVTQYVVIRNLTLDGNRGSATGDIDGIFTGVEPGRTEYDDFVLIENVEIHDVSRYAFNIHEQSRNVTIRDCVARDNTGHGYVADFTFASVYENNVAYNNGLNGFDVVTHSHDMLLSGNIAYDNGQVGIAVQRGSEPDRNVHTIAVVANEVYGNADHGIRVTNGDNIQVTGNLIHDNGTPGMMLRGVSGSVIYGNQLTNNRRSEGDYEIKLRDGDDGSASTGNLVVGNTIVTDGPLKYGIQESHETTLDNTYLGNVMTGEIGEAVDVRSDTATIDENESAAAAFSYMPHPDPRTVAPEEWTRMFAE